MLLAILAVSCLVLTACHSCEFGEWTVIKQSTCTETGLKVQVCECGESRTEIIPATGHSHASVTIDPTCTEQGYTTHTCGDCGDSYVDAYVNATGHNYSAVVTPPTCTEQGFTTHTCACGDSYVDTHVEAAGVHNYSAVVTEPTCTRRGFTTHTCDNCGASYIDTYVEATGVHNFQQSDMCDGCGQNIVNMAVELFDMSATVDDNVIGYVVPRQDDQYDVYIKGTGAMKDYEDIVSPFYNQCYTITNGYICYGVTTIGYGAFLGCSSLTSIVIPNSVTNIGLVAFAYCTRLTDINVDENSSVYKSIEGNLYSKDGKTLIQYAIGKTDELFIVPNNVTKIDVAAFFGCENLTSVTIPNSVVSIGELAFYECVSLTNISIPSGLTSIGDHAFIYCTSLTDISVEEGNAVYKSINGDLYSKDGKTLIQYALGKSEISFVIPYGVTSISEMAFAKAFMLENITIPATVTSIGYFAFGNCIGLTSVTFEDPNGWYVTQTKGDTSGTNVTLTNTDTNVDYFSNTYAFYYWYKNN